MSKKINARIVQKHDIEDNWLKAVNFVPMQGEIVVYDKDENYDYERIKVGDGVTLVSDLSFVADAIDERLDAVEAVVMPAKSVVSGTWTEDYNTIMSGGRNGGQYTVPDGYKCTSIKVNITPTFENGSFNLNFFNQDPDTATSYPVISSHTLNEGENTITDIPEECVVFNMGVSNMGNGVSGDTCTFNAEIIYEEDSSRIEDIESKLTTVETDVSALETEVDTLETSLKAKLNIKADAENVNEAVSALDNGKVVSIVTDAFTGGYDEYIDDGIGKTYMLLDGCTSIEINITADFEGTFGGTWFNQNPDTATSNPVMGSYTLNKGENIITEIPEGCKAFSVSVNEITNSSSGYACTFDVKIVYEKASVIDERIVALDARLETVEAEVSVKANTEYVDAAILALDDGSVAKVSKITIPSTYQTTWSADKSLYVYVDEPMQNAGMVYAIPQGNMSYSWDFGYSTSDNKFEILPVYNIIPIFDDIKEGDVFTLDFDGAEGTTVYVEEVQESKINTRLATLESNKKVPATFNSSSSLLDNSSTEFVVSSGGVCEPWVEFDVGMPYDDSTGVINNGSSFGGYLTTRYYLRYMGSVENSNIARHQTVIVENTNTNKDEIYIRRGTSGITVVSQNEDGSYVCTSDNNWTNTAWARIDAETETPPTLTSVTTDGVAIGTDNWTGTGYFCTSSGTKYKVTHKPYVDGTATASSINGFNRFCLKFAENTREWQNWTPYFTYNGNSYEFFYSPTRCLYEALIPETGLTAVQVLNYIEWKKYAPTILNYGKLRALGYCELKDAEGNITKINTWIEPESILRDTSGNIDDTDWQKIVQYVSASWWDSALYALDRVSLSLIFLQADINADGNISNDDWMDLQNVAQGYHLLSLNSIDNFS